SHGTMFFAHDQWAGKGQRGKSWTSAPGENIILSTVLEPANLPIIQQFSLSAAVALACHDLFSRYAGADDTAIKWPNDLYWREQPVRLKKDQAVFSTVVKGVTPTGELITRDVLERHFSFGEVEWVL